MIIMNQTISEKLFEVAEVLGVTFEDIPSNKQSFFAKHPREMSRTRRFFLKKMLSAVVISLNSILCSYSLALLVILLKIYLSC